MILIGVPTRSLVAELLAHKVNMLGRLISIPHKVKDY